MNKNYQKSFSDDKIGGFTLIELLVVVLIVGILAAIALPQYEKAVEKSRATEALTNLRTIVRSMQLYRMANGQVTQKIEDLDVIPNGEKINDRTIKLKNFTYDIRNFNPELPEGFEAVATRNDASSADIRDYYVYCDHYEKWRCVARKEAAAVPCAVICGTNQFRNGVSGTLICEIQ